MYALAGDSWSGAKNRAREYLGNPTRTWFDSLFIIKLIGGFSGTFRELGLTGSGEEGPEIKRAKRSEHFMLIENCLLHTMSKSKICNLFIKFFWTFYLMEFRLEFIKTVNLFILFDILNY